MTVLKHWLHPDFSQGQYRYSKAFSLNRHHTLEQRKRKTSSASCLVYIPKILGS